MLNTTDYLYLILVPSAQAWRGRFPEGKAPFNAIRNFKQCRVEFLSKKIEKEWVQFCEDNKLQNDATLKV